ncbi:hypothetical protein K438DRAFT_164779 [Mycena galopus ATCC 62051]|nr:hypothetical protein K438DRAFT_164779 [Mycena galopus ATCC 62051]
MGHLCRQKASHSKMSPALQVLLFDSIPTLGPGTTSPSLSTSLTPEMLAEFAKKLKRKYDSRIDMNFLLLSLMREKGFEYHPADFGSSARFDPPNRTDAVGCPSVKLIENVL